MKIGVLGSGNGGCAVAFDCASRGHRVGVFDFARFPDNVRAIRNDGGIHCTGVLEDDGVPGSRGILRPRADPSAVPRELILGRASDPG